jgi:hypothetical protein
MDGTLAPAPTGCTLISRRAFARPLLGLGALGLGGCTTRAPIENEPAEVPDVVAPFSTAAPGTRAPLGWHPYALQQPATPSFETVTAQCCMPGRTPQPPVCAARSASIP